MRSASIRRAIVVVALLQASAVAAADRPSSSPTAAGGQRSAVPGRVIVKWHQAPAPTGALVTGGAVDRVLAAHGVLALEPALPPRRAARKQSATGLERVVVVRYASATPPEALAAALAGLPEVEYAEPQWVHPIAVVPNDPSWPSQTTAVSRMRFPQAWDLATGQMGGVVVAVVDGGTQWNHDDLVANIWSNPGEIAGNATDDDGNGFVDDVRGWNFANNSPDPTGLPTTPNNAFHGTHVAGIVCAVTNNGNDVAGASWNARLMPICASSTTSDNGIAFGYQGILYAADNGADVVNCSWGSTGSPSVFEQDVITYAWERGTVVVAAAGNGNPTPTTQPHYPGSYPHALSVANVDNNDVRVSSSNYGITVDVSAQGSNILSTAPGGGIGLSTGTSMSSPFVAGACALVKTRWPGYTADQVMERVRVTADNIDAANPARAGLLGYGRINVQAALTKDTPAVRIVAVQLADTDGDDVVEPGETVDIQLQVTNFLAACTGIELRLRETSPHASVADSVAMIASLDSLQTTGVATLRLVIAPSAPIGHTVGCIVAITTAMPAYTDKDRFIVPVLSPFATHDVNRVNTSVTSLGKLGFAVAGGTQNDGVGFRYSGGPNLIYEAGLMIGTASNSISDAARTTGAMTDDDFVTSADGVPRVLQPGPLAPQQTRAAFSDGLAAVPLPVSVRQESYAYTDAVHDAYVILRYAIRNDGTVPLTGLRVGWFCDWDIDGSTFDTNRTGFDAARHLGWARDGGGGPTTWVGVQVLNAPGATSYRGIWNDGTQSPDWGIYDGFSDTEKWDCLAGGFVHPEVGPGDIANAIATGPFDVAPGDTVEVGFAFLGGDALADLQAHADAAALKWQHLHSGTPVEIRDLAAVEDGGRVVVRWRTARERDVAAFRVLRSANGGALARLEPDLAPDAAGAYVFTDQAPERGACVYHVGEVQPDGGVRLAAAIAIQVGAAPIPARTWLAPAAPNPFNPATVLRFAVAAPGAADLVVFDARGRRIRRLWGGAGAQPGEHAVRWDGRDDAGRPVASGAYVVRLRAGGRTFARRVTLLE
jgi:hypothetical protein